MMKIEEHNFELYSDALDEIERLKMQNEMLRNELSKFKDLFCKRQGII